MEFALRQFGQQIIERLGGKRIHPAWVVPGGVSEPLSRGQSRCHPDRHPRSPGHCRAHPGLVQEQHGGFREEISTFGNFPTLFMGIVEDKTTGSPSTTASCASSMPPAMWSPTTSIPTSTHDFIGEKVEPWSYLKSTYYKPKGFPDGIYRVGPLARLNVADRCGTPRADQELAEFHELQRTAVLSSFHYHHARLIEILYCVERMEQLLNDRKFSPNTFAPLRDPTPGRRRRGRSAARHAVPSLQDRRAGTDSLGEPDHRHRAKQSRDEPQRAPGGQALRPRQKFTPGMLNRVEAVIRGYDPCLSCSTHAVGEMPLRVSFSVRKENPRRSSALLNVGPDAFVRPEERSSECRRRLTQPWPALCRAFAVARCDLLCA